MSFNFGTDAAYNCVLVVKVRCWTVFYTNSFCCSSPKPIQVKTVWISFVEYCTRMRRKGWESGTIRRSTFYAIHRSRTKGRGKVVLLAASSARTDNCKTFHCNRNEDRWSWDVRWHIALVRHFKIKNRLVTTPPELQ